MWCERLLHCSSNTHRDFLGHRKVTGTGRGLRFLFCGGVFLVFVFFFWSEVLGLFIFGGEGFLGFFFGLAVLFALGLAFK